MAVVERPVRATPPGVIAVLAPVVGFALMSVIVKISAVSAPVFALYRLTLGVVVMGVVMAVARRRLSWEGLKRSLPAGALFGLNIVLFFSALKLTSIADVLIIAALQPALTLLVAGPMFGEQVTRWDGAWTGVSLVGVALVAVGSSGTPVWSLRGDLLAVGSLLAWTVYFLVSKRVRARLPATEYMTGVTIGAALVAAPIALLSGEPLTGFRTGDLLWLVLFVAGAQCGHVMIAWAHAHVDVSISALLILVEPPVAAVSALVILGEPLPPLSIAGGLVVLVAMAAVTLRATRSGRPRDIVAAEGAPP